MLQGADARILSYYRDRDVASFTELCKHAGYPTDLGAYYIARLVRMGYLNKLKRGAYQISVKGKRQTIDLLASKRLPTPTRIRIILLLVGTQAGKYICIRRKVQPFLGKTEWPAGEVYTGEALSDAARRLTRDRIGEEQPVHMQGFFRRVDRFQGITFDDKLFAIHTYELPSGFMLPERSSREDFVQFTAEEISSLENPSKSLADILRYVENGQTAFEEHVYELEKTDLQAPKTAQL